MILGLVLYVALFLLVFGVVFALEQAFERDALWGIVVGLALLLASTAVFALAATLADLTLSILVVLFTISKFGLEQSQHEALLREEIKEARRQLLRDLRILDWYEQIRDHYLAKSRSTAIGRFMAVRISDTFLHGLWKGIAEHLEFGPGIFGRLARTMTGLRDQAEGSQFLKAVSRLSSVLVIVFAVGRVMYVAGGWDVTAGYRDTLTEAETVSLDAEWCCGKYVGDLLARKHRGAKAMLIVKGLAATGGEEDGELLSGLHDGLAGKVEVSIIEQVPRPSRPQITTVGGQPSIQPEKEVDYNNARFFDGLTEAHPECTLVISTAGFPRDFRNMVLWKRPKDKCPHIVLINADISGLKPAIERGIITAVVNNPRQGVERVPDRTDPAATFKESFLLLNSENAASISEQYREVFGD